MLTAQRIQELRAIIERGAGQNRAELVADFDALTGAIAAQALTIRALAAEASNTRVGSMHLDEVLGRAPLDALAAALGRPIDPGVTLAQAQAAAGELADRLARGADWPAVLAAIARIANVFI